MLKFDDRCGCGKPAKYINSNNVSACNKHKRCPSYDEVSEENNQLKTDIMEIISCAVDLKTYNESSSYYKNALVKLEEFKKKYGRLVMF